MPPRRRSPAFEAIPPRDQFTQRATTQAFEQAQSNLRNAFLAGNITWPPGTPGSSVACMRQLRSRYAELTSRSTVLGSYSLPAWLRIENTNGWWAVKDVGDGHYKILGKVQGSVLRSPPGWAAPDQLSIADCVLIQPVDLLDRSLGGVQRLGGIVGVREPDPTPPAVIVDEVAAVSDHAMDAASYLLGHQVDVDGQRRTITGYDPGTREATVARGFDAETLRALANAIPDHFDPLFEERALERERIARSVPIDEAPRELRLNRLVERLRGIREAAGMEHWVRTSYGRDVDFCRNQGLSRDYAEQIADSVDALRLRELNVRLDRRLPTDMREQMRQIDDLTREAMQVGVRTAQAIIAREDRYRYRSRDAAASGRPASESSITEATEKAVREFLDTPKPEPKTGRRIKLDD